ncbi:MFS transporter [Actinomadura sp. 1N219]|uniref:MFS transporter n=1 Tax=Actinomadura sp. 1N219 TaxID=3375152 RepID=UPI003788C9CC
MTVAEAKSIEGATRRPRLGLVVLVVPTVLLMVDFSVLYLALPGLAADLRPSGTQQLWIVDVYGFMIAGFLVTMGTLGDRIGRRRLLLGGATVFAAGSVAAAFAGSAEMLITARAVMGIAGATVVPSTLALISVMFTEGRRRAMAIAVWMGGLQGGLAAGPLIGGLLLEWFWWGSVFLLGVPVMVLTVLVGRVVLPEERNADAGRLDPLSVVLSLAAILPLIHGLKELARHGWEAGPVLALVVGLGSGAVFVRRQSILDDPLLDLGLLRNPTFRSAMIVYGVPGITGGGTFLMLTVWIQMVGGLSPVQTGLALVPASVAMVLGSLTAPWLAHRFGTGRVITAGLAVNAASYLLIVARPGDLGPLITANIIGGLGIGPMTALIPDLVIGSAPPRRAGSAASIMQTSGELGIALGVAVLGTIGMAVYRGGVDGPARESIADAVAESAHLPAAEAAELVATAERAFASGLAAVAAISAIAIAGCAVLAARVFRRG